MKIKSKTYFFVRGLNQERVLNEISKILLVRKVRKPELFTNKIYFFYELLN